MQAVASKTLGMSGRAMLDALIAGERDPEVLADLARGRLRDKIDDLVRALHGEIGAHHRFCSAWPGARPTPDRRS
jgi:transposase